MALSGELAKTLLELAPDATIIVDSAGRIVFANVQVESTFGHPPAALVGQSIETLIPRRFRDAHLAHRGQFAAERRPRPMGTGAWLFGLHEDGHEFPVDISLSPVATPSGMLVVAAIRDITAHFTTEHELAEANRAKSRFLAAASHDLRQPLQTLHLLNRVAARQASGDPVLKNLIDRKQRALDSMSSLLESLLDVSKLDSGAVVANHVMFPIGEVLDRLRSDFEPQAVEKGLELRIEADGAVAHTDPELLRRLLGNLLSNAIRYTVRGRIDVNCAVKGKELTCTVRDTGIGIPADQLGRIFEEFYQVSRGAQRPEGLGLGLAIVSRLAKLMGCRVTVSSTVGEGSVFTVTMPRGELPAVTPSEASEAQESVKGRILVVDDEPAVAEATCLLLQVEGFDVDVANGMQEALEHAGNSAPEVIVTDYYLRDGETGTGVVTAVRDLLARPIPAVLVTGDIGRIDPTDTRLGGLRLLRKPLRADDLLAAVRTSISAPPSS